MTYRLDLLGIESRHPCERVLRLYPLRRVLLLEVSARHTLMLSHLLGLLREAGCLELHSGHPVDANRVRGTWLALLHLLRLLLLHLLLGGRDGREELLQYRLLVAVVFALQLLNVAGVRLEEELEV